MAMSLVYSRPETKPVLPHIRKSWILDRYVIVNFMEMFDYSQCLTWQGHRDYVDHYIRPADAFCRAATPPASPSTGEQS